MRLTEKFGASDVSAPVIKRSLDAYLQQNPIIDNMVSYSFDKNFVKFNFILI